MLRQTFNDRLKQAMKAPTSAHSLDHSPDIGWAKDRDIAARGRENAEGPTDAEIKRTMIKQRRESITLYEQGNRDDLVHGSARRSR